MSSTTRALERRLHALEERRLTIIGAAQQAPRLQQEQEVWWPSLLDIYRTEQELFVRNGIDRRVFDEALNAVSEVPLETRGRKSSIRTPRERLLFLAIYLAKGVSVLEILVGKLIKKRDYIHRLAEKIAKSYHGALVQTFVRFNDERLDGAQNCRLIIDCTVCQIKRPKRPFDEAKIFFGGKHYIYALKKEVCVNNRTGTAAVISKAYHGSVHDIQIMREHADELNEILGDKTMLGDLGYIGGGRDVHGLVVCDQANEELRRRRVLVECFFGRLKSLWSVFSSKWPIDEKFFDRFFNIACALTNVDILYRPLQEVDHQFNIGVLNLILIDLEVRAARKKRANERYVRRRLRTLNGLESDSSETLELSLS